MTWYACSSRICSNTSSDSPPLVEEGEGDVFLTTPHHPAPPQNSFDLEAEEISLTRLERNFLSIDSILIYFMGIIMMCRLSAYF